MNKKNNFWDHFVDLPKLNQFNLYKKAILRAQLAAIGIAVGALYIGMDLWNGISVSIPYYFILILASLVTLYLNKKNHTSQANLIFLLSLNFLEYLFASNDIYRSGVSSFFIITNITALTLYGYEHLRMGIFFVMLSICLFFLGYVFHVSPLQMQDGLPEKFVQQYFVTNFLFTVLTSSTLLFFLLNINFHSEETLRDKNQLLKKNNQELDRFVYSVSHDLRSPLSSIMGLVEIARLTDDKQEIITYLNLINDRIKKQDAFIRDIIDYARNARTELNSEHVILKEVINEIISQLMFIKEAEKIDIQVMVTDELSILADKVRLSSVLSNLLSNAIKYQDPAKAERYIKISAEQTSSQLILKIEDNGIGISPEYHEKIFQMFFRASENSKGSGIGLFIVKEMLAKMNGSISVESALQKGSCFTVRLPI
ncbi:MAG: HAMP domain-containing histidine kinase [Bacteroidetes bacterium]|nr:HAMP domain-containing histidine kinase [Bacteroidota bacterium]